SAISTLESSRESLTEELTSLMNTNENLTKENKQLQHTGKSFQRIATYEFEREVQDFTEDPQPIRSRTGEEYIVTRPRKKFVSSATQKKRGTAPQWKYTERQREAAELIALAHDGLRGTPGVPEFSGGTAKTDSEIIQREVEKLKAERNQVVPKKRGRPPKANVEGEPKIPKKRGRPPKAKVEEEPKIPKKRGRPSKTVEPKKTISEPKKRETVAERLLRQNTAEPKRQSVADRFGAQKLVRPTIPADSVVTKVGPGRYNIEVNLNREKPVRPTRKAPNIPEGVSPWRPVPKPRTVFPRERPIPKPRTKLHKERPVPKPQDKDAQT
ncbi:---NA---, partial [Paramuricea clavata]